MLIYPNPNLIPVPDTVNHHLSPSSTTAAVPNSNPKFVPTPQQHRPASSSSSSSSCNNLEFGSNPNPNIKIKIHLKPKPKPNPNPNYILTKQSCKSFAISGRALGGHMRAHAPFEQSASAAEHHHRWQEQRLIYKEKQSTMAISNQHAGFIRDADHNSQHLKGESATGPFTKGNLNVNTSNIGLEMNNASHSHSHFHDQYDDNIGDEDAQNQQIMYGLRRKNKRIRRFSDDFAGSDDEAGGELHDNPKPNHVVYSPSTSDNAPAATPVAPAAPPAIASKKQGFTDRAANPPVCTECGKEFHSWKALFGHMRCHPEREWRGIQPPVNRTATTLTRTESLPSNMDVQYTKPVQKTGSYNGLMKKKQSTQLKSRAFHQREREVDNNDSQYYHHHQYQQQQQQASSTIARTMVACLQGHELRWESKEIMLEEEEESDTESIEAAYISATAAANKDTVGGDQEHIRSLPNLQRGKRSKRSHPTVRSLKSMDQLAELSQQKEAAEEIEMANCLVMLALAGSFIEQQDGNTNVSMEDKMKIIDEPAKLCDDVELPEEEKEFDGAAPTPVVGTTGDDSSGNDSKCEVVTEQAKNDVHTQRFVTDSGDDRAAGDQLRKTDQDQSNNAAELIQGMSPKLVDQQQHTAAASPQKLQQTQQIKSTAKKAPLALLGEQHAPAPAEDAGDSIAGAKFECTTCKRIFKSHQALGGHRASHKKVKGCFAKTSGSEGGPADLALTPAGESSSLSPQRPFQPHNITMHQSGSLQLSMAPASISPSFAFSSQQSTPPHQGEQSNKLHQCSICLRVFSSGQALGGHKRCHWVADKVGAASPPGSVPAVSHHDQSLSLASPPLQRQLFNLSHEQIISIAGSKQQQQQQQQLLFLDLNLPAPAEDNAAVMEMASAQYNSNSTIKPAAHRIKKKTSDEGELQNRVPVKLAAMGSLLSLGQNTINAALSHHHQHSTKLSSSPSLMSASAAPQEINMTAKLQISSMKLDLDVPAPAGSNTSAAVSPSPSPWSNSEAECPPLTLSSASSASASPPPMSSSSSPSATIHDNITSATPCIPV